MLQILSLQPRESSSGGGRSNDDIVTELAEELEAQIPPPLDDEDAGPTTFVLQVKLYPDSVLSDILLPVALLLLLSMVVVVVACLSRTARVLGLQLGRSQQPPVKRHSLRKVYSMQFFLLLLFMTFFRGGRSLLERSFIDMGHVWPGNHDATIVQWIPGFL